MNLEPSMELPSFATAFPPPDDVFAGDVSQHRRVLQPLLSIEASAIDPAWRGKLHIVTPLEPYDGLVGDETEVHHSGYTVNNWIAFKVANSKYEFLGDFRYFRINSCKPADVEFLRDDYAKKEESYAAHVQTFRESGQLGDDQYPREWLEQVGGVSPSGNWCAYGLPVDEEEIDGEYFAHPLTADGRRFRFVASVQGFNYRDNCADGILLFFDPQTSIAVLTFDWT